MPTIVPSSSTPTSSIPPWLLRGSYEAGEKIVKHGRQVGTALANDRWVAERELS
jgi:hypothetical protein